MRGSVETPTNHTPAPYPEFKKNKVEEGRRESRNKRTIGGPEERNKGRKGNRKDGRREGARNAWHRKEGIKERTLSVGKEGKHTFPSCSSVSVLHFLFFPSHSPHLNFLPSFHFLACFLPSSLFYLCQPRSTIEPAL
jgi:hypothetical protein